MLTLGRRGLRVDGHPLSLRLAGDRRRQLPRRGSQAKTVHLAAPCLYLPLKKGRGIVDKVGSSHCEPVTDVTTSKDRVTRFSRVALVWQSVFPESRMLTDIVPENGFPRQCCDTGSE